MKTRAVALSDDDVDLLCLALKVVIEDDEGAFRDRAKHLVLAKRAAELTTMLKSADLVDLTWNGARLPPPAVVPAGPAKDFSDLFDAMVTEDLRVTVGDDPRPWAIEPFSWRTQGACVWLPASAFMSVGVTPYWEGEPTVAVQISLGEDYAEVVEAYSADLPEPLTRESYVALLRSVMVKAHEHAARATTAPVYSVWVASADPDSLPRDRADVQILNVDQAHRTNHPEVELLGEREALIAFLREHWSGLEGGDEQWFLDRVASFEPRPGARVAPLGSPERGVEVSP